MDDQGMFRKEPAMNLIETVFDDREMIKRIVDYHQKCEHGKDLFIFLLEQLEDNAILLHMNQLMLIV